jgi:hypothetical protein
VGRHGLELSAGCRHEQRRRHHGRRRRDGLTGGGSLGGVTLSLAATPVTQDAAGYARLPVTPSVPPAADCNEAAEAGRMKFETAADVL